MENPLILIASIVALFTALVASGMSYISMVLSKESKISEFRQKWIDDLREDLAQFAGAFRAVGRAAQEQRNTIPGLPATGLQFSTSQAADYRFAVAERLYKVQLRLNANEAPHVALLAKMDKAVAAQQEYMTGTGALEDSFALLDGVCVDAIPILKTEWDRVKLGEPSFHRARLFVGALLIGLGLASVVAISVVVCAALQPKTLLPRALTTAPVVSATAPLPAQPASTAQPAALKPANK